MALNPIWKRNVSVFGPGAGGWTEGGPNADGSYTYINGAVGDTYVEWENGRIEEDRALPPGTTVTFWPESGLVRISKP